MKIDGKISGMEHQTLQAFFYLSLETHGSREGYEVLIEKLIDPATNELWTNRTLSSEETQSLLNLFEKAHMALASMSAERREHFGVTPSRWKLFHIVIEDIRMAKQDEKELKISSTHLPFAEQGDLSDEPELTALLGRFALLAPMESARRLLGGRVVAYASNERSDSLMFFYLDQDHLSPLIQQRIRHGLLSLYEHGIEFYGFEGSSNEFEVTREAKPWVQTVANHFVRRFEPKRCWRNPHRYIAKLDKRGKALSAQIAVECLLGEEVFTTGVESDDLLERRKTVYQKFDQAQTFLDFYKASIENYELDIDRGQGAPEHFLQTMEKYLFDIGAFTFGVAHATEIFESLEGLGINYIFVDPRPSVWE